MQYIETKYIGASNTKPGRIRAKASGGMSVLISYPHDATNETHAHAIAADTLRVKCGWGEMFEAGATKRGLIFVFPPKGNEVWIGR